MNSLRGLPEEKKRYYRDLIHDFRYADRIVIKNRVLTENLRDHLELLIKLCDEYNYQVRLRIGLMTENGEPVSPERQEEFVQQQGYTYVNEVLTEILNPAQNQTASSNMIPIFKKIELTDKININEITTYFSDLLENGKIATDIVNLERVILAIFQQNGKELSKSTVNTYLKKSKRFENRSKKIL